MAIGTREQPEKYLDRMFMPKSFQRLSRKWHKTMQNRKDRHLAKNNPETPKRRKYLGWEW